MVTDSSIDIKDVRGVSCRNPSLTINLKIKYIFKWDPINWGEWLIKLKGRTDRGGASEDSS